MEFFFQPEEYRYIYMDENGEIKIADFCPKEMRASIEETIKLKKKQKELEDNMDTLEGLNKYLDFMFNE